LVRQEHAEVGRAGLDSTGIKTKDEGERGQTRWLQTPIAARNGHAVIAPRMTAKL